MAAAHQGPGPRTRPRHRGNRPAPSAPARRLPPWWPRLTAVAAEAAIATMVRLPIGEESARRFFMCVAWLSHPVANVDRAGMAPRMHKPPSKESEVQPCKIIRFK